TGEAVGAVGARADAALVVRLAGPAAAVRRLGREIRDRVLCRDVANEVWGRIAALPLESRWTARLAWPAAARPEIEFAGYGAEDRTATAFDRTGLERCIHCGLCLEACPTYKITQLETESPRGRLHLMGAIADRRIDLSRSDATVLHLDRCLACRACEAVCPSG